MKYNFQLQDFPNAEFQIETSVWTGKSKLFKDGILIEQSREKGKPFLIPDVNANFIKAYPKPSFPDIIPSLEINGTKYLVAEKLKWYEYTIGGLPIILLFLGGALGGGIGAVAAITNFNIFRQQGGLLTKYIKVLSVVAGSAFVYFMLSLLFTTMLK